MLCLSYIQFEEIARRVGGPIDTRQSLFTRCKHKKVSEPHLDIGSVINENQIDFTVTAGNWNGTFPR